jgi:uncharacterized membrane protein HdeD (DUF308 family)
MNDVSLGSYLARQWGWLVLRGLVAVAFGVMAFAWPEPTLIALTLVWGAYAFLDGVLVLIAAFRMWDQRATHWPLIIVGLLGMFAGIVTFIWPNITAVSLLLLIAVWAIAMGAFQIASAIQIRKSIDNEWSLGFSGVVSMIFGAVIIDYPQAGALAVAWMIGTFAIPFGLLLVAFGFRLRGHGIVSGVSAKIPPLPHN